MPWLTTPFAPVTPGEMLREEFLKEYGLSQNRLARAIGISPNRIAEIVANRRRISADTALRLGLYFGNSPEFWLNLQSSLRSQDRTPATLCGRCRAHHRAPGGIRLSVARARKGGRGGVSDRRTW